MHDHPAVMGVSTTPAHVEDCFSGGGEMGARMRTVDWSTTPLGPVRDWPQSLRTAVSICLQSRFPIVLFWGPQLVLLYNDAYAAVLGPNKHPRALCQPGLACWAEIAHIIGPMLRGVLERGEATWSEDQLLPLMRAGFTEESYFTFSYSPIFDAPGRAGGVFCAVTETTHQVVGARRQHTLRELGTAMLQAENADEACACAARVLAENPADLPFFQIFFHEPEGAVRIACEGGAHADDAWLHRLAHAAASGHAEPLCELPPGVAPGTASGTVVLPLTSAGGFLAAGLSARHPFDEAYRGFVDLCAARLSSAVARARAYEEERRRAEALAALDRAKTEFFSNVSHELRTPLTLILGPVEDALRTGGAIAGEPLSALHRNARRLLRMVNALLDFSRIEAGRAHAQREPVDLAALTSELASVFRAAIEAAGLSLVVDCPPLPAPVWVDRQQWEKIVLNLVSNAFKFTFAGTIRVALGVEGDHAVLRVSDTGTGIPAAEVPHVFDRFHRVEGARARTHEGTGIGLSLVRELVRMHDGDIDVESEVGHGTTFTARIPLDQPPARAGEAPAQATPFSSDASFFGDEASRWLPGPLPVRAPVTNGERVASASGKPPAPGAHVLIVDDNADMRGYLERLLRDQGLAVEACHDGTSALEAALRDPPHLVLTDVMMPGLDGFGLLRALRADERTARVPVLMLSARAGEEARVDGFVAGADDYLVKPFSARELCARVGSLVELSRLRRVAEEKHEALRRSEAALRESTRRKDEFLALLGHELRTPLLPMQTALQLLDGRLPADDRNRRPLEVLRGQTATLARLIEDFVDVSRITRGVVKLRRERLDVARVVRGAFEAVRPLVEERKHATSVAVPAEPVFVMGDAVRLEQVVVNLLTNSTRYTEPGGRIALVVERDGDHAQIRVRDSGIGIAPDRLGHIFDLFTSDTESVAGAQGGLGVGLALVKALVEQHGGTVTAQSAGRGAGAELVVRLPLAPAAQADEPVPSSPMSHVTACRRVLVVDDDPETTEMLGTMLAEAGHAVSVANDGPTALRLAGERPHDVILVDLGMPEMDGFEVARRLRQLAGARRASLIAVTGYGGSDFRLRSREAGFDMHVVKPLLAETLAAIMAASGHEAVPERAVRHAPARAG